MFDTLQLRYFTKANKGSTEQLTPYMLIRRQQIVAEFALAFGIAKYTRITVYYALVR